MPALLLSLFLSGPNGYAEYRVFELHFVDAANGQERTEISNLDPVQYRQYYPHSPSEKLSYVSTWMCKGNTSFQNFCPDPKAK